MKDSKIVPDMQYGYRLINPILLLQLLCLGCLPSAAISLGITWLLTTHFILTQYTAYHQNHTEVHHHSHCLDQVKAQPLSRSYGR
jgi:hypothetical protein